MPKLTWKRAWPIIGVFVLVVSAVDSADKVITWITVASTFLFQALGHVGTAVSVCVGILAFWLWAMTPRWMYESVPERFRRPISWILFVTICMSLLALALATIGRLITY